MVVGGCGFALKVAAAPDPNCVSYLTVGDSDCRAQAARQTMAPPLNQNTQSTPPAEAKSEVDRYLDNYGKPPREFVEFYLNPTAENASRWMQTYQQMIQKGQDLSKAWTEAEQLYRGAQSSGAAPIPPALIEPQEPLQMPSLPPVQSQVAEPAPVPAAGRFGAFADALPTSPQTANGIRPKSVSLTYFFSQTCPYCTRMNLELAVLSKEKSGKLTFTCVDVTPVGPTSRPDESYITSKLPCKWRLPDAGEVEREGVQQTPTLVIQKEGELPVRLSGYVPLAQLRQYF